MSDIIKMMVMTFNKS